jgi:hypothetical protein
MPGVTGTPDVVVGWLQHDFGQLGRPAEAVARALVRSPRAGRVAYVEPFRPAAGEPALRHDLVDGLHVFRGTGAPPAGEHEVAQGVVGLAGLRDPLLLNFGVAEANWWLHYELGAVAARTVLVTHDKLATWGAMASRRARLERVRERLVAGSDVVCGLSLGAVDDVPGAVYVGHGCDDAWHAPGVDALPEPADLAAIPHPRAVYVGALSARFEHEAVRALARSGVHVVVIGIAPQPALLALAAEEPNVHLLGPRAPERTPAYLVHCDLGIVPHTDEAFTRSMEPHKAYNYAAAGLRTVTLHTEHAPALGAFLEATATTEDFVAAAARAVAGGRLGAAQVAEARALSWDRVADALLDAAGVPAAGVAVAA